VTTRVSVLLVDDEPLVRSGLRRHLAAASDFEVVGEAGDGLAAIAAIENLRPQLVLLDVQMPELDGFSVLQLLGAETLPAVVFVTAYDRYALRAFDVHAVDYVLKPFDRSRLFTALERARQRLHGEGTASLSKLLAEDRRARGVATWCGRAGGRLRLLPVTEIEWLEAAGNYVRLHHRDGEFLVRTTLQQCEADLARAPFVRVHRSAIVNLDAVLDRQRLPGGDFRLRTRHCGDLLLSRTRRAAFDAAVDSRR